MSASSRLFVDHVTPSVPLESWAQPTSLKPSSRCGPGHSCTIDGQRLVVAPNWVRYVEPDTLLHVGCVFVSAVCAAAARWPAGLYCWRTGRTSQRRPVNV